MSSKLLLVGWWQLRRAEGTENDVRYCALAVSLRLAAVQGGDAAAGAAGAVAAV